ncbi:MAG: AbrB/MazE/SpoVT family DNA-binding domain-containing protein [Myxococcota bacterium]|nr:AbrB/MazE/SpoVT family DNA-binding domain-containing protein [Myxococcota bacterium]
MHEALSTTKMSSRGQVVIPESIREQLGLKAGDQFIVVGQGDVVMLKVITPPSIDEYDDLKKKLRRHARREGLKRSDIGDAIKAVRAEK